jgi:GT2 family glycosyltransferase
MEKSFISIIVPTCYRVSDLERCLARLVRQVPSNGSCEIIVSDDGDVNETKLALEVKFPLVRWMQGPRKGPAANRNYGASHSSGEWLLFLDDDVLPSETLFESYFTAISQIVSGADAFEGATFRESELPSLLWESPHNPHGGNLISCNFAIRREVFESAGRFDERFPVAAFEDTEFAARLQSLGVNIRFIPEACVLHPLRRKPNAKKLACRWESKAIYAFYQGATPLRVFWNLPWHVLRVIQSRFRGQPWSPENMKASLLFAGELLWVLWLTPFWVWKYSQTSRHPFWVKYVDTHGPVAKYGF